MVQVPGTQHEQNMSVAGLSVSSELSASFLLLCALMLISFYFIALLSAPQLVAFSVYLAPAC